VRVLHGVCEVLTVGVVSLMHVAENQLNGKYAQIPDSQVELKKAFGEAVDKLWEAVGPNPLLVKMKAICNMDFDAL
jgi:hypothetical protein